MMQNLFRNGVILFVFFFFLSKNFAQNTHKYLRMGDDFYKNNDFAKAENAYRKADDLGKLSGRSAYNLGNALYQQKSYDEALLSYEKATKGLWNNKDAAQAFYNLGNVFFEKKEYAKSVEAYKNSLRRNPENIAAKKNLVAALRKLQEQQKSQQPQQNPDNQRNKPPENSETPQNQREEERLLKVAEEEEKQAQRNAQRRKIKQQPKNGKDW